MTVKKDIQKSVLDYLNAAVNLYYYIPIKKLLEIYNSQNETNSINIEIVLITNEEKLETTTYSMETIQKVGISEFISNFNTAKFRITKLEYHPKTGRIKYIEITQQY